MSGSTSTIVDVHTPRSESVVSRTPETLSPPRTAETDIQDFSANHSARVIQRHYKKFKQDSQKREHAAMVIQRWYRKETEKRRKAKEQFAKMMSKLRDLKKAQDKREQRKKSQEIKRTLLTTAEENEKRRKAMAVTIEQDTVQRIEHANEKEKEREIEEKKTKA